MWQVLAAKIWYCSYVREDIAANCDGAGIRAANSDGISGTVVFMAL